MTSNSVFRITRNNQTKRQTSNQQQPRQYIIENFPRQQHEPNINSSIPTKLMQWRL